MTHLYKTMFMMVLVLAVAMPLAAQEENIAGDIANAEAAIRSAEAAGAAVYATSLYREATARLTAAKQNADNSNRQVRASARLDAIEAMHAAEAAEAKAKWISSAREANDLRDEIMRFGGEPPAPPAVVEESDVAMMRGADSRERVAYAQSVVNDARERGAAAADAAALNLADQYLETAARIVKSQRESDTADYLAYQAEMTAREALYKANMQSLQGLLPGLRLERTRLAEVSKEREAAAEKARREQLEREAAELRNQLMSERQNREAQAAELTRLRNQMEENQRQIQQQMMQDRQARLDAEQRLRSLAQEYDTAMQGEVGSAELARLRRQIEDQAAQIRTIQQRETLSDRAMADQLQRMREDLVRERAGGFLTPAQLTAREETLNQTAAEFERIRRERQEAELTLQRLTDETVARVAQNEERLRAAEERARAAEAELQAQRDRMAKMEEQLSTLAETRRDERGFIVTLPGIFFDTGKSELKQGSRDTLARIANELKSNEAVSIVVEGHTDSVGSDQMNQQLSERRANSVRAFLVENGVPAARVTTIGRGEGSPVASNDTASGRQQNRRVELVIQQAR